MLTTSRPDTSTQPEVGALLNQRLYALPPSCALMRLFGSEFWKPGHAQACSRHSRPTWVYQQASLTTGALCFPLFPFTDQFAQYSTTGQAPCHPSPRSILQRDKRERRVVITPICLRTDSTQCMVLSQPSMNRYPSYVRLYGAAVNIPLLACPADCQGRPRALTLRKFRPPILFSTGLSVFDDTRRNRTAIKTSHERDAQLYKASRSRGCIAIDACSRYSKLQTMPCFSHLPLTTIRAGQKYPTAVDSHVNGVNFRDTCTHSAPMTENTC